MYEVPEFIEKSQAEGFSHFINDAGGSLCELEDPKLFKVVSKIRLLSILKLAKKMSACLLSVPKKIQSQCITILFFLRAQ